MTITVTTLVREFAYNGVSLPDPGPALTIEQVRDVYLTAIVIGPTTLPMSQWYGGIWGGREEDAPAFDTLEEAQRITELIMRHYNGIISSIQHDPDTHEPLFDQFQGEGDSRVYVDGEMWAYGFMQGVALCRKDWQSLFDDPLGPEWLNPIRLLGDDDVSEEEMALIRWPAQREQLAQQIGKQRDPDQQMGQFVSKGAWQGQDGHVPHTPPGPEQ